MLKNKRGISPLIATVLIIGFTIVLAALVITWGTRLFKTTVEETELASKFSFACSTGLKLDVIDKEAPSDTDEFSTFRTTMRNNNQDQIIGDFRAVLHFNSGDTGEVSEEGTIQYLDPTTGEVENALDFPVSKEYAITAGTEDRPSEMLDLSSLESVDIYPVFTINGETKACETPLNVNVPQGA